MMSTPISRGGILGPGSPVNPGRGLNPSVSALGPAIERVWPPTTPGGVAGNSLGFMAALSRDPGSPLEVRCGIGYTLALDPEWTTPVAQIGVSFTGSAPLGSVYTMRPGDVVEVPDGFDRFWIHNADVAIPFLPFAPNNRGYCAFLIGRTPGAIPHFASRDPSAQASVIGFIRSDLGSQLFVINGLKTLFVDVTPLSAAFAVVSSATWSCVVKLIPYTRIMTIGAWAIGGLDTEISGSPAVGENLGTMDSINVALAAGAGANSTRAKINIDSTRPMFASIGISSIEDGGIGTVVTAMAMIRGYP